jgi:hypothetical protein
VVAAGGLVLGVLAYVAVSLRYCADFRDVTRGSALFRLCCLSTELIAAVPVVDATGGAT